MDTRLCARRSRGQPRVIDDAITGLLDWSEAGQGDPIRDLAILTLGHEQRLADIVAGYATGVDLAVVRGSWSMRNLRSIRWLAEHASEPFAPGDAWEARAVRHRWAAPARSASHHLAMG